MWRGVDLWARQRPNLRGQGLPRSFVATIRFHWKILAILPTRIVYNKMRWNIVSLHRSISNLFIIHSHWSLPLPKHQTHKFKLACRAAMNLPVRGHALPSFSWGGNHSRPEKWCLLSDEQFIERTMNACLSWEFHTLWQLAMWLGLEHIAA